MEREREPTLIVAGEYMRAAGLAPKALGYDLAAWTHYVERFIDENHLNVS